VTAVYASNFTNFMYVIAADILRKNGIPFELLTPIIRQTATNVTRPDLFDQQTGPAIREDMKVIEDHLNMLSLHAGYPELYDLVSKSIIKHKKRND